MKTNAKTKPETKFKTKKETKTKTKQSDNCCDSQCVKLELTHPSAQHACIAGSFNDWHPSITPMIQFSDGKWEQEITLPLGRHEYRFVVDGEWLDDPAAKEFIQNPFGTANAVLVVAAVQPVTAIRVSALRTKATPQVSSAKPKSTQPIAGS